MKLVNSQRADPHYFENAKLILELSENASRLFKATTADRKRQLIKLMVSNCSYSAGKLDLELKPVLQLIMQTTKTGNWCPLLDTFRTKQVNFNITLPQIQACYSAMDIKPLLSTP